MALRDLMIENPQPVAACLKVACGDCAHFQGVPYYTVEGKRTVCSHERIGRTEDSVPCPHFAMDTHLHRRITPAARDALATLLVEMGLGWEGKKNAQRRRDNAEVRDFIKLLHAVLDARRVGLSLSSRYTFTDAAGETREGRLITVSGANAVLVEDAGTPWTVHTTLITPVA